MRSKRRSASLRKISSCNKSNGSSDFLEIFIRHDETNDELSLNSQNCRVSVSDAMAFRRNALQSLELRHSFVLRYSSFVILTAAFMKRAEDCLFFHSDVLSDDHQFRAIEFKWLQFPAARDEIEKLRAIGEADETLRANHARRQAICKAFETIARKNFAGSECERFESCN